VDLLRRIGLPPSEAGTSEDAEEVVPASVERAAPGVASLLEGLTADGTLSVLDLGSASESSFRLYAQFARRIRFADVLVGSSSPGGFPARLEALGPGCQAPFDLVLAWNILDWLRKEDRSALVERLVHLTTPEAKLYVLVDASERPNTYPHRFTLLDRDRVLQQPVGPSKPAHPQLLPAEVERLLTPFRVSQGFCLRQGWREYVAVKEGGGPVKKRGHSRF
jgi:hypothetical protein